MEEINADVRGRNVQPVKRKFFQWAVRWFYANISEETKEKPDAPALACLLQSLGFQLREFEKTDPPPPAKTDNENSKNESVKVTIECGTSGMRALLEMRDVKCQCPNSEDARDASFWSVSGTGPVAASANATASMDDLTNKVEETGSNLLPLLSKDMKKLMNEILYRLLNMIRDKTINENNDNDDNEINNLSQTGSTRNLMELIKDNNLEKNEAINIVRSRTQPEIAMTGSNRIYNWPIARPLVKESISKAPSFSQKRLTDSTSNLDCSSIDGDQPRPSPPKIASSPVILNQLCSSLGQISLQSEEEAGNLAEHVLRAHRSLEKAVEILLDKRSPLSRNSPNYDEEGTFLKPPASGLTIPGRKKSSSSCGSLRTSPTPTISRPGSSCSMPGRIPSSSSSKPGTGQFLSSSSLSKSGTGPVLSSSSTTKSGTGQFLAGKSGTGQILSGKSPVPRRSVGSALTRISTTPLSSTTTGRRVIPAPPSTSGTSKIPPRRKSFSGHNLKLSLLPNSANLRMRKNSKSPINPEPEERIIIHAKRRVSPDPRAEKTPTSGIQTPGNFQTDITTGSAGKTCKETNPNIRKSLVNPKFGFTKKKT